MKTSGQETRLTGRFRVSWELLEPRETDHIISVGCKEAVFESWLAGRVASVTAIDINRAVIDSNRRTIPGITFEYGDILAGTGYPDERFDKIVFLEVLEHLPRETEQRALAELYRILKKGGTLVLSTPNDTRLTRLLDPAWWLIEHRHYRRAALVRMLRDSRFTVEAVRTGGGFVELVWIPVFYLLLRMRLDRFVTPFMERLIDREYRREGFYTLIMKCRKC